MYSITDKGYEYLDQLRRGVEGEYGQVDVGQRRDLGILVVLADAPRDDEWERDRLPEDYKARLRMLVQQGYANYEE